jgi:hypothetical protein
LRSWPITEATTTVAGEVSSVTGLDGTVVVVEVVGGAGAAGAVGLSSRPDAASRTIVLSAAVKSAMSPVRM